MNAWNFVLKLFLQFETCFYKFQIKGHNITVIATDGYAVEPLTVDCVITFPGERYDVVMHATNDPAIGSEDKPIKFLTKEWIVVVLYRHCIKNDARVI